MPTLTDEIKTFIVKGLACYDTPTQVAEAVKVRFDVEITRQHVYAYDPNATQHMSPRWRELHAATRAALLRETAEIGIAHRAVRLLRLDRLASRSERNNVLTALKCFEMAAKECGGMYENRKPIVFQPALQPAMPEPPPPQHAAIPTEMPRPVATRPARRRPPAPLPSAPPPVIQQPSVPERAAPEPQALAPQRRAPLPALPLPVMPQPAVPVPAVPVPAAPQPLAVLAQPSQPATAPVSPPLSRVDRYLAYVRDRHARDRAVAAQALLDSAGISTAPPAS